MGTQQSRHDLHSKNAAFSPKELYNLKQVYFFLCLHTTTLTSCPLDRNQFHSLFVNHKQFKPLWQALFNAIDTNEDAVIDFEEFLAFVTYLKRGDIEARRRLCFRLFDSNHDGFAEQSDFQGIAETKAALFRRPLWQQSQPQNTDDVEDEYMQFFHTCDEDQDGRINFEDFENYCSIHGEAVVNLTLKLLDATFGGVIEETGIVITATDVKNTKPHIDWQDHKIGMGSFFCCSTQSPVFTTPPVA